MKEASGREEIYIRRFLLKIAKTWGNSTSEELSDDVDSVEDASSTLADISNDVKGDFCLTRLQGKKKKHHFLRK